MSVLNVLLLVALGLVGGVLGRLASYLWTLHRHSEKERTRVLRRWSARYVYDAEEDPPGRSRLYERWYG